MTRGQDPDAELLADWLRTLQVANPQPKARARTTSQPREGKTAANPAEADALRKRAKSLRAKARRQEAAGDTAAAEATRAEVADLLRKAKGA